MIAQWENIITLKLNNMEKLIDLWLKAEDENRKDNTDKALELKDEFHQKYLKLDKKDQKYLNEYLDSIGA